MEDRYVTKKVNDTCHVAAVFDGHSGDEVANFCSETLAGVLRGNLASKQDSVLALKSSLTDIDESARKEGLTAGSTACVLLLRPNDIVTANVGDSRAILFSSKDGGVTYDLSKDHKPDDDDERDRIYRAGGFVTSPKQTDGVHRVMGRLSLSRALGDWDMRPWVSPNSDVTVYKRSHEDQFALLATDGVWDVMSSDEVGKRVSNILKVPGSKPKDAITDILDECRRRDSGDNVTILLVDVGKRRESTIFS
jgi:protein phosphatase 2C